MTNHIEKMWLEYEHMVLISDNVSPEDRAEFRQTFYTGAAAVFAILVTPGETGDDEEEDERKATLAMEMHAELLNWAHHDAMGRQRMKMKRRQN